MLCMGATGTGNSKLIHALVKQACLEGLGHVIVSSYTGVSCAPFLTLFNINPLKLC
jgi:predicted AAA+ superfamily ATPase